MTATDRVIVDGRLRSGMIQGVFQLRRKLGLPLAEFRSYWLQVHAPIVQSLPRLRHYQQCLVLDDYYGYGEPYHDGVEEIWFDDYEAAREAMNSSSTSAAHPRLRQFLRIRTPLLRRIATRHLARQGPRAVAAEIKAKVAQGWRAEREPRQRTPNRNQEFQWSTRFISSPASRP